jgi:hypothetical protein
MKTTHGSMRPLSAAAPIAKATLDEVSNQDSNHYIINGIYQKENRKKLREEKPHT